MEHPHRPRLRVLAVLALTVAAALALTGCGSSSPASSGSSGATQQIAITIKGKAITPKNKRVAVPVNKPITLSITSDRPVSSGCW